MKAIHVHSTGPFRFNPLNQGKEYKLEDFNILTTILSALKWREKNGTIKLYTDNAGKAYFEEIGILSVWDEVDTDTLETAYKQYQINHAMFWAIAKIFAMMKETEPFFMMDTDFIVWDDISHLIENPNDLMCIHLEDLFPNIYIPKEYLKKRADYEFPSEWDWSTPACNGALVYHGNMRLKEYYTSEAIRFMHGNMENAMESGSQMCFVEQRVLGMCAKAKGIQVKTFMDHWKLWDFEKPAQGFPATHTWGWKQIWRDNDDQRKTACTDFLTSLIFHFPRYYGILRAMPVMKRYFENIGHLV